MPFTGGLTQRPMFALVLTGPPGVGKTSVLEALSDALTAAGLPPEADGELQARLTDDQAQPPDAHWQDR
jgi:recombinational DNA repair ATPase RecF